MNRKKIIIIALIIALIVGFLGYLIFFKGIFSSKIISINAPERISNGTIIDKELGSPSVIDQTESVNSDDPEKSISDEATQKRPNDLINNGKEKPAPKKENSLLIINKPVSWGFAVSSGRKIDTIIIHSSYDAIGSEPYSVSGLIKEYKQYGVASHYLIDREGNIYRLVDEKDIAYHAGKSQTPDGRTKVNDFSLGVELMNKEDDKITDEQYNSINMLIKDLKSRYNIKYVLGHNQIAPGRKTDPWNFDWNRI